MHKLQYFLMLVSLVLIPACGSDPVTEGDKAWQAGEYQKALGFYLQAQQEKPDDPAILQKVALGQMAKGWEIYKMRKNMESFAGNFEKGQNLLSGEESDPAFLKEYSRLLFELANAYNSSKAANEIKQEQYFNKTLELLDLALQKDPDNTAADELMDNIRSTQFESTYKKGLEYFEKASKTKNGNDYLLAEQYLDRAVYFDPYQEEAVRKLGECRKKTLAVPNFNTDFPFAIVASQYKDGYFVVDITGFNPGMEAMTFQPDHFILVDSDGNEFQPDAAQTDKFDSGLTKPVSISVNGKVEGVLAYKAGANSVKGHLVYRFDDGRLSKKYLR